MSVLDLLIPLLALAIGAAATPLVAGRRRATAARKPRIEERILFPFVGSQLSGRALEAALRLARAEQATVVPAYLASVPLPFRLDAPLPRTCDVAFSVFEAIERRAARAGVPVDARIARGRDSRHALRQLIAEVPARRIVVSAATPGRHDGFTADEIAWLMRNAPHEVVAVRPDPADRAERPQRADECRLDPRMGDRDDNRPLQAATRSAG